MTPIKMTLTLILAGMTLSMMTMAIAAEQRSKAVSQKEREFNIKPKGKDEIKTLETKETFSIHSVVYKPPKRGAPGGRVGGGTRGPQNELPVLYVLAPDHLGLTTQEQPDLYWYISQSTKYPIEVTVMDEHVIEPLIEQRLQSPSQPGVYRVRLADYGVRLSPNREYRWSVAVIPDPTRRSKDIIAGARIEHVDPSEPVLTELAQADLRKKLTLSGESGFWYDAVATVSQMIHRDESYARAMRASLLDQVGLREVSAYDRRVGSAK